MIHLFGASIVGLALFLIFGRIKNKLELHKDLKDFSHLSEREIVLELEALRLRKGYSPNWLVDRCREIGLLELYQQLRVEGVILSYHQKQGFQPSASERAADEEERCRTVLGIQGNPSEKQLKTTYKDLISFWHPDKAGDNPRRRAIAESKTKEINEAYQTLKISVKLHQPL